MDLQSHRKLLQGSAASPFCLPICDIATYCEPECLTYHCPVDCSCTKICLSVLNYDEPPPATSLFPEDRQKSGRFPKLLVAPLVVLSAVFLVVCFGAVYYYYRNRRTHRRSGQTGGDFREEDHQGPILDHPIWYIRTTGLQPSIISSIAVLKYKKGEGVVDGTDCSVCLSEFQEEETLRLLPKCNHAFHASCIDTWLRSHTSCPLCRAPIVTATPFQTEVVNSGSAGERQVGLADEDDEAADSDSGGMENSDGGLSVAEEDDEAAVQSGLTGGIEVNPRRSASLDSFSAARINSDLGNAPATSGRSKGSSSNSRSSSKRSGSIKRSFSCSGVLSSSRYGRSQKMKATGINL